MLAHGTRDEFKDGHSEVSIAMMAVILCANLEKLVVESNAAIRWVLPASLLKDCATLSKTDRLTHSRIPLSNLRTSAIQAPTQTDQLIRQESAWWNDGCWLHLLSNLPDISYIEISSCCSPIWYPDDPESNLTSLTIVDLSFGNDGSTNRSILTGCPALECLDLTVASQATGNYPEMSTWSEIGRILNRHGTSLRKFR